ncbi:MAG: hypothetical protein JOZ15_09130 [Acidobacteria bacterium]|nr:hypothetical protein [Acidobacteriota bacterium]
MTASPSLLSGEAVTALVGRRLRILRLVCGALFASVVLLGAASVVVVKLVAARPVVSTTVSLTLTLLAAALILATSRLQASILARPGRGPRPGPPAGPELAAAIAGAYARATVAGFALLAAAAALGMIVAGVTATLRYALVICGVAALGMLARWPRRAAILRLLRRRGLAA